ncbi:MAG TPA: pyridoxamine 5'-phosphate oxidase family protein [Chloroflexota bacterium]
MDEIRQRMLAYMGQHITMTLATALDGEAHAATVFYANDGFDLYFISDVDTAHGRHMLANPRVFVTISQDYDDWQAIQGIQLSGRAELLEDATRAGEVYGAKFPFIAGFPPAAITYWKIDAGWVRFTDNTQGFAHKDEIALELEHDH